MIKFSQVVFYYNKRSVASYEIIFMSNRKQNNIKKLDSP